MNWISLAAIGLIFNTIAIILIRRLGKRTNTNVMTMYIFVFLSFFLLAINLFQGKSYNMPLNLFVILSIVGLAGGIKFLYLYEALSTAPNAGYPVAMVSFGIIITTIISAIFLNQSLELVNFIGVLVSVAGMILLSIK